MKTETFAGHEVRILELDGQDWFVTTDIFLILDPARTNTGTAHINTLNPAFVRNCPSNVTLQRGRQPRLVNRQGAKDLAAISASYLRDAFQHWIETGEQAIPDPRPWKLYLTNGCVVWAKCPEDALGPADSDGPVLEIDLTFIPRNAQVAPFK